MAMIQVKQRDGGSWCVYVDGRFVSDHATHVAARQAARNHRFAAAAAPNQSDCDDEGGAI